MSDAYVLVRNAPEAQRLDEQFDLLTKNIGYLINPQVSATLPPNPRIADIATGTGHFLVCVRDAGIHPGATLDGYDVSPAMYPEVPPEGISLTTLDVKEPVPQHLHETYDLVHVRLIVGAMMPEDWPGVVRNLSLLLKPGGWLQWEEPDITSTKHFRGRPDSRIETAAGTSRKFIEASRHRFSHGWNRLHLDMSEAGLTSIIRDCVSSDRVAETREKMAGVGMRAIISWARKTGALGDEDVDQTEREAFEDIKSGCYYRYDVYVICGQKPVLAK